jgi:hypothetical protein
MKRLILIAILFFASTSLYALTPFSLNGVTEATVHVADYSGLYDEKMKNTLEALMHKKMEKLGIESHKFHNESLIIWLKSQVVGKSKMLLVNLMLTGDVSRVEQKHLTFGVTYLNSDNIEIEDKDQDVIDSVDFLLEEFADQYIQDNEE